MASGDSANFDIDEAEEEALLKSDEETEADKSVKEMPSAPAADEDSLMQEASQLEDHEASGDPSLDNQYNEDKGDGSNDKDNDDESCNDEDLDDEKALVEYKKILEDIQKQQYAYDKYVRLCEISHITGELDCIRNAYSLFSATYPLAPELWQKYLSLEASVALSPKEIEKVEDLFRHALRDYYSTELGAEFAKLAVRTQKPELIWREVLGTYGLNCMKGQQLFKQYREYIAAHATMSPEKKQMAHIQSFLQELKYPLYNMEESYIEFKVYYEKNKTQIPTEVDWKKLDDAYYKAKDHLRKILPYEETLMSLEKTHYQKRAETYLRYIKESDIFLDENVLQTVYERMVADCCLNSDCWLAYNNFIDYRDEFERPEELQDLPVFQQTAVDINSRALRNCTWSEKLYIKRILLLEKLERPREEIQEVLENSMSADFQEAEPVVAIWLEYLTYLRRHTDWQNEEECEILRKNFNLCWTILGQQWGVLADCDCEILQFWGRLEYGPLQDPKRGKELWATVMESSDNAAKSGLWIEFTQMEMRRDLESTRRLFRKALYTPGIDNPLVIASAWQRFERCNGTVKTLTATTDECEKFIEQLPATDSSSDYKSTKISPAKATKRKSNITSLATPEKKSRPIEKVEETSNTSSSGATDRGMPSTERAQTSGSVFKEHENQEIDLAKDHLRIFVSNLDYKLTEEELRSGLPEIKVVSTNLIRSANGKSRGFGYLELESAEEVEKALTLDRRSLNGRPIYISSVLRDKEKRQKFKYSDGLEPRKLFIKGLAPETTKEELEKIYSGFGKVVDVRIVYHKSGKSKNIAYVEFDEERAASKALMATDQTELRGHTITVAISAPPPKSADNPSVNQSKLLGIHAKRGKVFDQKPRMSLIPNSVRKKLDVQTAPQPLVTPTTSAATTSANGVEPTKKKTNEDFRKLLQK